jgi:hypothetical protein
MAMTGRHAFWLGGLALAVCLAPATALAQTAQSFEDVQRRVKTGQTVRVTERTGQQTTGKVAEVSPSSLTLVTEETTRDAAGNERRTWTGRRTFVEATISELRRPNSVVNGALIGAGVGAGLSLWDYLIDPSEPGNAAITAVLVGVGLAAGAGIDALVNRGGELVYAAPRRTPVVTVSPLFSRGRRGAVVSVYLR